MIFPQIAVRHFLWLKTAHHYNRLFRLIDTFTDRRPAVGNFPDELYENLKRYEETMVQLGTEMLRINIALDVLIRDILSLVPERTLSVAGSIPLQKGGSYEIASCLSIAYDEGTDEVKISAAGRESDILWSALDIAAKDMLLNTIIIGIASDDIYNRFSRH